MATGARREQQRRELVVDILSAARLQLEAGGPTAVGLRGIAREVGMSAPSLYTYFPSLGHLFTALIVQSCEALAEAVRTAISQVEGGSLEERLIAGPRAYRTWALQHRQQFNLVFFDQISGYQAPPEGPTVDAQIAVLEPMAGPYAEAKRLDMTALRSPGAELAGFLAWWGGFHGVVALEVNHHLDWVDADEVFERRLLADAATVLDH